MQESLSSRLTKLRPRQVQRISELVDALLVGTEAEVDSDSDFASEEFADEFGDYLQMHHNASSIPLTKDKFEYALVSTFQDLGIESRKLSNGNPGADVVVAGEAWSLKTQADRSIKFDSLHISKFKELGRGRWEDEADVAELRQGMFDHMRGYDRIIDLRCLSRTPIVAGQVVYSYELVEIPKRLLLRAGDFPIEMKWSSRQTPKPASCYVYEDGGRLAFELYFDGGTERKLQVRSLAKRNCRVHAIWTVTSGQ